MAINSMSSFSVKFTRNRSLSTASLFMPKISFLVKCTRTRSMSTASLFMTKKAPEKGELYLRLSSLGIDGGNASDALDQWVNEGNSVTNSHLEHCIRRLRIYGRFKHGLEAYEWMEKTGKKLSHSSHAIRIDLLSKNEGLLSAEKYFYNLPESMKTASTYGALLSSYSQKNVPDKALELFTKMKELNFDLSSISYNVMMTLYMKLGEPEKVSLLFQEMIDKGISPDTYSFNTLMNSYASLKDIPSVEKVMEEIKTKHKSLCDWTTYSNLAAIYIDAGLFDKANSTLSESELKINSRNRQAFHFLLTLYARAKNPKAVHRIWMSLRSSLDKTTNRSYAVMLHSLAIVDDFDGLKKCFEDWESNCTSYDVRLANVLIKAYIERNMIKEAESLYESVMKKVSNPNFYALDLFMGHYLKTDQLEVARNHLLTVVSLIKENDFKRNSGKTKKLLKYFEQIKDVDGAEGLCKRLKEFKCLDSEAYSFLLQVYISAGRTHTSMRQRIKGEAIQMTPDIEDLLQRVCPE